MTKSSVIKTLRISLIGKEDISELDTTDNLTDHSSRGSLLYRRRRSMQCVIIRVVSGINSITQKVNTRK